MEDFGCSASLACLARSASASRISRSEAPQRRLSRKAPRSSGADSAMSSERALNESAVALPSGRGTGSASAASTAARQASRPPPHQRRSRNAPFTAVLAACSAAERRALPKARS